MHKIIEVSQKEHDEHKEKVFAELDKGTYGPEFSAWAKTNPEYAHRLLFEGSGNW